MFDSFFPPGRLTYVKSNFVRDLNDEAIRRLAEFAGKSPSLYSFAPFVEHWHGAATRVGVTDTVPAPQAFLQPEFLVELGDSLGNGSQCRVDAEFVECLEAASG
jgi:hypothetical protein